ncbi:hypothetical protein CK203_102431 [Vitis vinifera]|uniref:Uncharacterized protein n=1 Tax=Vitis vinifera TaxID=29760 RepID=A0A438CTH6_VITVI|nr:hypothetical protein CK203_102431 [Vitis vinifera]
MPQTPDVRHGLGLAPGQRASLLRFQEGVLPRPRLSATSLGGCGRAVILITANTYQIKVFFVSQPHSSHTAGVGLHGSIPDEIGTLSNLTFLDLSRNSLTVPSLHH